MMAQAFIGNIGSDGMGVSSIVCVCMNI